jgi:starvation-inducible DNA-binding protein
MESLNKSLLAAFASTFSFYLKAQNFHWNVEGSDFLQYHELFGKIYSEVYGSIDDFAEKIRALDIYAPASFSKLASLSELADEAAILTKDQMVAELLTDNTKMLVIIKNAYDQAEEAGEHGFSNFLAERLDAHRKHGWMLKASTK